MDSTPTGTLLNVPGGRACVNGQTHLPRWLKSHHTFPRYRIITFCRITFRRHLRLTLVAAASIGMDPASYWRLAAASGGAAVLLGAFGAHALRSRVAPELLTTWTTASTYHLVHSLALLAASSAQASGACGLLAAGTLVFSGSLYALVLTGRRGLGAVTPIGGLLLVAGWVALARSPPPWAAATAAGRKEA